MMPAMDNIQRILIIDDDFRLRSLLVRYFGEQGLAVKAVADGSEMDKALALNRYHLLVLDLMLPNEDGLSILRRLRGAGENVPVILLTAKGDGMNGIIGLEMGADDYLPKPFNPRELVAHVSMQYYAAKERSRLVHRKLKKRQSPSAFVN